MDCFIEEIISELTLPVPKLQELSLRFEEELENGLLRPDAMLKMLPTFVFALPTGSEVGKYLTVDLGGTNLRVALVDLLGNHKYSIRKDSWPIPDSLKSGHGTKIFTFIAQKIEEFLAHPEIEAELPLKLGFTFSFPIQQESLQHGCIMGWSKEIECADVIGQDAVKLLQESLHQRGLDISVEALVNDTVGTLLAQKYRDDRTGMSVILGTGSNAAYIERCSEIKKQNFPKNDQQLTLINIEWGTFGDTEAEPLLPLTRFDVTLDSESKNSKQQKFEKMISGMYLGEIFRLILCEAVEKGIFNWTGTDETKPAASVSPYSIKTKDMSDFHEAFVSENREKCLEIIAEKFKIECSTETSDKIITQLARLCESISLRSCCLCAVGITAVYRRLIRHDIIKSTDLFTVAVDGSLYQHYPNYSKILQELVCQMTRGSDEACCRIVLVMAEDLSSVGAAAAIAAIENIK